MNFELSDEQREIARTSRELLTERKGSADLWTHLCSLGWSGIAIAEEHGGQGLELLELVTLVHEHGYACAETPLLGATLAAMAIEAGVVPGREAVLAELAHGVRLGALAIDGECSLIPDAAPSRLLISIDRGGSGTFFSRGEGVEEVAAIDPTRRHGKPCESDDGVRFQGDLSGVLDRAAVVVAAELTGLCRRALDLTIAYIKERTQFGVPVGSFQAVQHAAAEMLRDTEAATTLVYHAAWIADAEPMNLPIAAAMAKASASSAGRSVTAAAIQLHGGMGFTWEAEPHWLFKRAQIDAVYLGESSYHQSQIARWVSQGACDRQLRNDGECASANGSLLCEP